MPISPAKTGTPRWKAIYQQLRKEVPNYDYGSRFYTIADICEKFAVSAITARRVLTELQSEGLVEKIPRRGTVTRHMARTMTVRMIVPDEARPTYFTETPIIMRRYTGMTRAAQQREVDFAPIPESRVVEMFASQREPVGFIVPDKVRRSTHDFLRHHKLPFILLDVTYPPRDVSLVSIDRIDVGYQSAKHLIKLGHRNIAMVTGSLASPHFRARLNGYRRALREAGIKFHWPLIRETDAADQWQNDNAMNQLMDMDRRPTAVITGDDDRAMFILKYCRENNINVPRDFSVLGYPNYAESALTTPPLTVFDANFEQLGSAGIELLLDVMSNPNAKPRRIKIKPSYVQRGSVDVAPINA